jgi:hypothetical protein
MGEPALPGVAVPDAAADARARPDGGGGRLHAHRHEHLLLPIHNPVYVAEQVATLDVIAGGRFIFGVGLGYRPEEFNAFDVEMKVRVSRFIEVLQVAARL